MKGYDVASASVRPELIERVESGEEPDRELDGDIAVAVYGGEVVWLTANYTMEQYPARRHPSRMHVGGFANSHVPHFTGSVDAVLSLMEQKLPGWCWEAKHAIGCHAIVWQVCKDYDDEGCKTIGFHMSSSPRALLAACLRAIQAQARTLADAHSKDPSRPAMPKEEDTHG